MKEGQFHSFPQFLLHLPIRKPVCYFHRMFVVMICSASGLRWRVQDGARTRGLFRACRRWSDQPGVLLQRSRLLQPCTILLTVSFIYLLTSHPIQLLLLLRYLPLSLLRSFLTCHSSFLHNSHTNLFDNLVSLVLLEKTILYSH